MLKEAQRLRSSKEFRKVYLEGRGVRGRFLILRFKKGEGKKTRFGLAPARKIKNAVMRNRLKRRMREICRAHQDVIKGNYDIVINISSNATNASYGELVKDFLYVMGRAGLLAIENKEYK